MKNFRTKNIKFIENPGSDFCRGAQIVNFAA